ncbi:MAG: hypothetical protein LBV51_05820 [Acholeplasmatales bacterium]|jgi:hypothetical protein|nr:hypothetical protein [Acholeplasmatales bacterium]
MYLKINRKINLLREKINKKCSINLTNITTFEVLNKYCYSTISSFVELDDLFVKL